MPSRFKSHPAGAKIIAFLPRLRADAEALEGSKKAGDELVEETLQQAILDADAFHPTEEIDDWLLELMYRVYDAQGKIRDESDQ